MYRRKKKADVHRSQNVITQKNGKNKNERIFSRFSLSLSFFFSFTIQIKAPDVM
jgi:hypothetical protein